jgi:uncharacterized membrane protein YphA (DoxX/SURF4 family)
MDSQTTSHRHQIIEVLLLAARWLLGGLFIYMGLHKVLHPIDFLKLVRQYEMVSSPVLLNSLAAALPWFEVFCGVLLVIGIAVRGTALVTLAMLIPFTIVVFHRAQGIAAATGILFCAVKFDCGCGGGEMFICRKLLENFGLMLLSILLLTGKGKLFAAQFSLPYFESPAPSGQLSGAPK